MTRTHNRPMFRSLRILAPLLAVALLAGCASTMASDPAAEARIIVNNERSTFSTLTIELVPPVGVARRLGSLELNDTETFTVTRVDLGGRYRLLADPLGSNEFYSPEFTLTAGDVVEWDLSLNRILVHETGALTQN